TYIGPSEKGNSKYIFGDRSLTQNKNWQPSIPKRKKVENSIKPLRDDELDKVYRKILSMLSLEDHHRKQLKEEGWTDELIKKYNFKSYPVEDYTRFKKNIKTPNPTRYEIGQKLHKEFGDLTGVPGLYIRENKKGNRFWTLAGKPGILFEITNVYGHVIGLRVRLDDPGDGGKYRWVSSYFLKEFDGIWKNLYECGCKANNRVSISFPKIRGDMYCCHLTEGEKKHKAVNEFLKSPCISVAGVDSWADILDVNPMTNERPVDVLKKMGVKMFIIAYDNDKYKNEAVMNSQIQVIEALRKENFMIGLAEWDSYMGIKIDDILFNGYKPMYFLV
ncbi:MAG: DUF3854 domain-containing protein, partial [Clostridia bacterium]|nr:DUF3854 domain-containing protein [Clostridia bacterium]